MLRTWLGYHCHTVLENRTLLNPNAWQRVLSVTFFNSRTVEADTRVTYTHVLTWLVHQEYRFAIYESLKKWILGLIVFATARWRSVNVTRVHIIERTYNDETELMKNTVYASETNSFRCSYCRTRPRRGCVETPIWFTMISINFKSHV